MSVATAWILARARRSRFQKGSRASTPLPSPTKTTAPAEQVEHHGQVAVPLADGDLVDGDLLELVQLGLAEAALQVAGLDVLDDVPTDLQVLGHVLDGHVPRQLQGVALEGAGVVLLGIGKADLDLPAGRSRSSGPGHLEVQQAGLPPMGTVRKVRSTPP